MKTSKRVISLLLAMLMILNFGAMSVSAKSRISMTKKLRIQQGKSCVLQLKGVKPKEKVKWSVGKKTVVKLSKKINKNKCKIIAKNPGTTYVRAKYKGKIYKCKVTVVKKKKQNITTETTTEKNPGKVPNNDSSNKDPEKNIEVTKGISSQTRRYYKKWKAKYVKKDRYCKKEERFYVRYSEETYNGGSESVPVTVSEAHGYGMLIMTEMASYDTKAHAIFDGMVRFYNAHRSSIGPHLMSWLQSDNGKALIDGDNAKLENEPGDSATDGDMDIAYALLRADKIWGSKGEFNYRQMAIDMIKDIWKYEVNKKYYVLSLGDWTYKESKTSKYYGATRCSDFIMSYLPVFASATGNQGWMKVYNKTYEIIEDLGINGSTGLLPDFVVPDKTTGKYKAAPAGFLEDENDGAYNYNSCRCPWRISQDYLVNGNLKAKAWAEKVTDFIYSSTNGDASQIYGGYKIDGTPLVSYTELCFTAPFVLAAHCTDNTTWYDALRKKTVEYKLDDYFGDTIKMLVLIEDDKAAQKTK
ncbi:MAG: hypothetical protein IKS48_10555 [Eubacterium sp.]|nr:hypothetical protein [Eubacterium sp.]